MSGEARRARISLRQAYRCPCEGESWPAGRAQTHAHAGAALGALTAVRASCGMEPPECPWHAWSDSEVSRVIDAWRAYDKGQMAQIEGTDPPNWIVEGALVFAAALDAARADVMEIERRERARHRGQ